jgi:hypothetical protein
MAFEALVLYTVVGGSIMFLLFCVTPSRKTGLGRANIWLSETFPAMFSAQLQSICGDKVHGMCGNGYDYLCFQKNPILQTFYLTLIVGGYGVFILECYPLMHPNIFLAEWHKKSAAATISMCLGIFVIACTSDPGNLTPENWKRFDNYPSHEIMFPPGKEYVGHDIPKIARSKVRHFPVKCLDCACPFIKTRNAPTVRSPRHTDTPHARTHAREFSTTA